jgi:hypothetical protein
VVAVVPPWPPVPGEPLSVGLTSVLPDEGKLDVGAEDPDEGGVATLELPDAGAEVETAGLAVFAGLELAGQEGELLAWPGFLLPVLLPAAVAVAVPLAVLLALLLAVAVEDAVAVPVAAALPLSLGLTLVLSLLPGLALVLPLAGTVPEPVGGTVGSALLGLADLDAPAGEAGDMQAVACALLWLADELAGPAPPLLADPAALPAPFRLGVPGLGLEEEEVIPTAELSETTASRSGGSARTTPMANTAQAPARIGLSSPSRQSRGRAWPRPPRPESSPPRPAFQRPARPARKPPRAAARLLAWAGPDRTRARMRSSPSGPGST